MEEQNQNLEEQNQNPGCLVYAAKICIVIVIIGLLLCFFIDEELGGSLVIIGAVFMAILYFLRLLF